MMRWGKGGRMAAAALGVALVSAAPATAQEAWTLRSLFDGGFTIVSVEVIPQDLGRRMAANETWTDSIMVTLQRPGQLAFCYFWLAATLDPSALLDLPGCRITQ